jgi:hypothetical protein
MQLASISAHLETTGTITKIPVIEDRMFKEKA